MAYTSQDRLSPMVCPLAKLGRTSPSSPDQRYLRASPASLDQPYHHKVRASPNLEQAYLRTPHQPLSLGSYGGFTGETGYAQHVSLLRCGSPTSLGRSSPCPDQGYHTLVSPSPPCWPETALTKGKRSQTRSCCFDRLPDDVVLKVFSWLTSSELCVCARVCRRWEVLAWEPSLWRTITLSGDNTCGDKAVRGVLRRLCGQGRTGACPTVERVFLTDGAKLTDKGLILLARRCPELTHVQLQGCSAITNVAVFELATRSTNLQHLDLTGKILINY